MAYHNPNDPGSVNAWKAAVAKGVRRALHHCPACGRASLGGTRRAPAERLTIWRCRYCGHEKSIGTR